MKILPFEEFNVNENRHKGDRVFPDIVYHKSPPTTRSELPTHAIGDGLGF